MALQLNKATKVSLTATKESLEGDIKRLQTASSSTKLSPQAKLRSLQDIHLAIGLKRYQLEATEDLILESLRAAATAGSALWAGSKEAKRGSHEYLTLKSWSWIIAFGSVEERKRLSVVASDLFAPEEDKDFAQIRAVLRLLQGYLGTGTVDSTAANAIVAAAGHKKASRIDSETAKPYAQGLIALDRSHAQDWNAAIAELVKVHEQAAYRGSLVDVAEGYMACVPLSLLRLGLERGLVCTTRSLHLPIHLVEQAWKRSASK